VKKHKSQTSLETKSVKKSKSMSTDVELRVTDMIIFNSKGQGAWIIHGGP